MVEPISVGAAACGAYVATTLMEALGGKLAEITWGSIAKTAGELGFGLLTNEAHRQVAGRVPLLLDRLASDRLPPNHDLARAGHRALSRTLCNLADAIEVSVEPDASRLAALQRWWRQGPRFEQLGTSWQREDARRWIRELRDLAAQDETLEAIDACDQQRARQLLTSVIDRSVSSSVHDRIRAVIGERMHDRPGEPATWSDYLAKGFPIEPGKPDRISVFQAWCMHFREAIKRDQQAFNIFIATHLAEAGSGMSFHSLEDWLNRQLADVDRALRRIEEALLRLEVGQQMLQETVSQTLHEVRRLGAEKGAAPAIPLPMDEFPFFVGLRPYRRKDAPYFFGREREIEEYLSIIAEPAHQTLLLKGRSGVGKSSLMLAGVLPRLPGGAPGKVRHYLFMAPGGDPFLSLARALNLRRTSSNQLSDAALRKWADRLAVSSDEFVRTLESEIVSSAKRVLYIDQLEELLIEDTTDQEAAALSIWRKQAFLNAVVAFLERDRARHFVVATLREDYADKLADDENWSTLTRMFEHGLVRWLRLPDHDAIIDRMVLGPCQRAGFEVDPNLLAALRVDVRGLHGWPPLLNACLEDMVQAVRADERLRAERRLTLTHYRLVGGLRDIVERRARFTEDTLNDEESRALPDLFARLVRIDHVTAKPTKERMPLAELPKQLHALARKLLAERLLSDEGVVELIHDSLFEGWPRLRRWIEGSRETLLDCEDFRHRARIWTSLSRPVRKLAREDDLADAFGDPRPGTLSAEARDESVRQWATASRGAELLKHVSSTADPEIWRLPRLLRAGVRLSPEEVNGLGEELRPFYYAICPDAIPEPAGELEAQESPGIAHEFELEATQQPTESAVGVRLQFFDAAHLQLTLGRTARYSIWHYAALGGQVQVLERLKTLGANVLRPSAHGRSSIDLAAIGGHVDTVRYLLSCTTDPQVPVLASSSDKQRNSIHTAAIFGATDVLELLLDAVPRDIPVDLADKDGWTPLLVAVWRGHAGAVKLLLRSERADVSARTVDGHGLLACALNGRNYALTLHLLDTLDASALSIDCGFDEHGNGSPLAILIEQWTEAASSDSRGDIEQVFDRLLTAGADPSLCFGERRWPLLAFAAYCGADALVQRLLKKADALQADVEGWTALNHALDGGQERAALMLIDHAGARLGCPSATKGVPVPLQQAVRRGMFDVTRRLLDCGARSLVPQIGTMFVVEMLANASQPAMTLAQGRVIELLVKEGLREPRHFQFRRDEAHRIDGIMLRPSALRCQDWESWSWAGEPVVDGNWKSLGASDCIRVIETCVDMGVFDPLDLERLLPVAMRRLDLPWYGNGELIEIALDDGPRQGRVLLLHAGDAWYRLRGESWPLHEANAKGLTLREVDVAVRYLDFFCALVHGKEGGAFRLLHRHDRITWQADAGNEALEAARSKWRPVSASHQGSKGFVVECQVKYSNALFDAHMEVAPNGFVEMKDDTTVLGNMPTLNERFVEGVWQLDKAPPRE